MLQQYLPIIAAISTLAMTTLRADNQSPDSLGIIPKPVSVEPRQGTFSMASAQRIIALPGAETEARNLSLRLAPLLGNRLQVNRFVTAVGMPRPAIFLDLEPALASHLGAEGYQLFIEPGRVVIKAPTTAGLFYGGVTLAQLTLSNPQAIPCVEISDYPRFAWRGMMLDSSRHFRSKAFVERFLDLMAMQKMNRFHWHLVDSEGWRLEIKKYPKLTQVSQDSPASYPSEDPHTPGRRASYKYGWLHGGGYYSQDDVREIVGYAAQRHISIMPEIEFPAHSMAALIAYPEFSTTGKAPTAKSSISGDLYNVDDKSLQFLRDVLTEVMELFPGEYLHFGGDEAPKGQWKNSPFVQQKMKELGLKNEDALQSWLFEQMAEFVAKKGRRAVGWQEIARGGIPKSAVVMPWTGMGDGITAANGGNDVIVATTYPNYFDSYQTDSPLEPKTYYNGITIGSVYNQTFQYSEIKPEAAKRILGAQAQLWAELMPQDSDVEYQAFPRSAALAEALWTPLDKKNLDDFSRRLVLMARLWDRCLPPVNYHYLVPAAFAHWTPESLRASQGVMEFSIVDPEQMRALAAGDCGLVFQYEKGGQGLNIHKVELVFGGRVVATDAHDGFTGSEKRRNIYRLHFQPLNRAASGGGVSIRVTADAGGSSDSYGDMTLVTGKVLAQYDPRNYPLGTVPLGYWQASDLAAPLKPVTVDLGGAIDKAGTYQVEFRNTGGRDAVVVRRVILSENGVDVATLSPNARCGPDNKSVWVPLQVERVDPSARLALRVLAEPPGGADSTGEIWISRMAPLSALSTYKPGAVLARWSPDKVDGDSYVTARIELPDGIIRKEGAYQLVLQYTGGGCAADFKDFKLFADSTLIASDPHEGGSGNSSSHNEYALQVRSAPPGAKYSIEFQIKGRGGADSNGEVRLTPP